MVLMQSHAEPQLVRAPPYVGSRDWPGIPTEVENLSLFVSPSPFLNAIRCTEKTLYSVDWTAEKVKLLKICNCLFASVHQNKSVWFQVRSKMPDNIAWCNYMDWTYHKMVTHISAILSGTLQRHKQPKNNRPYPRPGKLWKWPTNRVLA